MEKVIGGVLVGLILGVFGGRLVNNKSENKPAVQTETPLTSPGAQTTTSTGKRITIGFSAPGTDHSWLGAVKRNAETAAAKFGDTDIILTDAQNSAERQASDVETLIQRKVDVIVMLPHSGKALTPTARKVREAGIPLIIVDRNIESEDFTMYIGGDNRGIGVEAARFIGKALNGKGTVAEVMGIAGISVTSDRHQGFADTLKSEFPGIQIVSSLAADFNAEKALNVTESILQAHPKIQAIYSHDDDMNVGVLQALKQAKRTDVMLTGAGGSALMMKNLQEPESIVKATFLYNPSMAGSAVQLARLIALKKGMTDLVELDVPRSIVIRAAAVTKDNVKPYEILGY